MRVHVFSAVGETQIKDLELKMNLWIADNLDKDGRRIKFTNTAFGQVEEFGGTGMIGCVIVTIWFE